MTAIPTEEQYPYENLDRLVYVAMRPRGMAATGASNAFLYQQARGTDPISLDIARALDPASPRRIGIFTGASDPTHYPNGENDGPLGSIVLAGALSKLGHEVHVFIDPQLESFIGALFEYYGVKYPVAILNIDSPAQNTPLASRIDTAIAVEKAGTNPAGKVHSITGYTGRAREPRWTSCSDASKREEASQ